MSGTVIVGLSLILTHELDAMTAKEWRIFPGLSRLDDQRGQRIFVAAHVPLFAGVCWAMTVTDRAWECGFSLFFIAHFVAHLILHRHPQNGFRRLLSCVLIGGAAVAGVNDLALGGLP